MSRFLSLSSAIFIVKDKCYTNYKEVENQWSSVRNVFITVCFAFTKLSPSFAPPPHATLPPLFLLLLLKLMTWLLISPNLGPQAHVLMALYRHHSFLYSITANHSHFASCDVEDGWISVGGFRLAWAPFQAQLFMGVWRAAVILDWYPGWLWGHFFNLNIYPGR